MKKLKKKSIVVILSIIVVMLIGGIGIYALTRVPKFVLKDNKTLKLEYGKKYSLDAMELLDTKNMDVKDRQTLEKGLKIKSNFKYDEGKDYFAIGDYKITMTFKKEKLVKKVKVVDATAPVVNTDYASIDIVKGTDLSKFDFNALGLFNASDLSPVELNYDYSAIDANKEGTYTLKVNVKDSSGNTTTKELPVNITPVANSNQELVTETITNEEGKKIIRNTLKNKEVVQEQAVQAKQDTQKSTATQKNYISQPQKHSSSQSSSHVSVQPQQSNQSFVANMSISKHTTQAITVVGNGGSSATLTVHTKHNGVWTETLSCAARVGSRGITGSKREGDKKTPRGVYSFGQAFGIAGNPGISRSYLQVNHNHYWVDDSNSSYYNKLVDASQTGIQWNSAEHLIDYPEAYRYAIAINYNTTCTPGAGSGIFLHCSTGRATNGCISVSQGDMIRILKMLQGDALIGIYQNKNSLY